MLLDRLARLRLVNAALHATLCAALCIGWAPDEVRFTTVPPIRTTAAAPLELRLSVAHDEPVAVDHEVTLLLDGQPLAVQTVNVPAGDFALRTHWLDPAGSAGPLPLGTHTLGYELRRGPLLVDAGSLPFTTLDADQLGPRFFQAGWLDPGGLLPGLYPALHAPTAEDLRTELRAMRDVGMDMLIVTYVEGAMFGWGPFYPSAIPELGAPLLPFDVVATVLDEADALGMHVFLGLGRGPAPLVFFPPDTAAIADALDLGTRVAEELVALYGHHPSLYGWYLTHEMNFLEGAALYYDPMGLALDAHGPERPLLVSPAGTPILTAAQVADSEVDIFAYQDAVGAGYVPYVYTFDPAQRLAMLDDVFAGYASLHAGTQKHLWANAECWEMGGPTYGAPYPTDWPRLRTQIEIERRHVPLLTTYEFTGFLEPPGSAAQLGGPLAVELFCAYRAWLRPAPGPTDRVRPALQPEPLPPTWATR